MAPSCHPRRSGAHSDEEYYDFCIANFLIAAAKVIDSTFCTATNGQGQGDVAMSKNTLPESIARESKKLLRIAKAKGHIAIPDRAAAEKILSEIAVPRDKPILASCIDRFHGFAVEQGNKIAIHNLSQAQELSSKIYGYGSVFNAVHREKGVANQLLRKPVFYNDKILLKSIMDISSFQNEIDALLNDDLIIISGDHEMVLHIWSNDLKNFSSTVSSNCPRWDASADTHVDSKYEIAISLLGCQIIPSKYPPAEPGALIL